MGISSEILWRSREGEWGLRLAKGWVLGRDYNNLGIHDNATHGPLRFGYASLSFHYSYRQYTAIFQAISATKSLAAHLGLQYRLSRPRIGRRQFKE